MRVLLTNHTLDERAGTELYVRDVALALLRRQHDPIAYSRRLGEVARELRRSTVPVIDDLERLEQPPDIIHGHHHLETMTALTRFPRTPAIYFCHGWLPDQEAPPRHPRILRYVAVDDLVEKRLLDECGIHKSRIEVHRNFVDLERFRARDPLPEKPVRALVFSNLVSEDNCLPVLRRACHEAGLELDIIGRSVGQAQEKPEDFLGAYDIVFAKGRAALEAASVGAAVILCDRSGLGSMVNTHDLDLQLRFNFGVRLLRGAVTVEAVRAEIERYDAQDAAEVNRIMRGRIGLAPAIERLIDLYERVVSEHASTEPSEDEDARATSAYLRWGPLVAGDFFQSERERLQGNADHATTWAHELHGLLNRAFEERTSLEDRLIRAEAEQHRLTQALAESEQRRDVLAEAHRRAEAEAHRRAEADEHRQAEAEKHRLAEAEKHRLAEAEQNRAALAEADREREQHQELARQVTELEEEVRQRTARLEEDARQIEHLEHRNAELDAELAWIKNSRTWRWRERLFTQRWLKTTYRALFVRRDPT